MQNKLAGSGNISGVDWSRFTGKLICVLTIAIFTIAIPGNKLMAQGEEKPAQKDVKNDTVKPHSPHKATIYSMALPGLGQAYNKKYWKIPIIYAGFGTLGYFIKTNTDEYRKFRNAYEYVVNEKEEPTDNPYVERYDEDALKRGRDYYRRNMELNYIFSAIWYFINIMDAAVDAHFYNYNVSDDLTLELGPAINNQWYNQRPYGGISLTLKINN